MENKITINCLECSVSFAIRPSHKGRRRYCSKTCQGRAFSVRYAGDKNPNYRDVNRTADGYLRISKETIHRMVVKEIVGQIPKGYDVHHRDCNIDNNIPENLVILSKSDHRWLHKEFGNAVLWAFFHQKIDLESLLSWSKDRERAQKLLTLSCLDQKGLV